MAKSQETFSKKEKEKRKQQKKKEKQERLAERRANVKEGKSLEDMMAYVDANGNLTNTPPDPTKKTVIREQDIVIGSRNMEGVDTDPVKKGRVMFFNGSKGYGFIKDEATQESVFVHASALTFVPKDNDRVSFETQRGPKGLTAVNIKKIG
jgi:cold shock CspA family protein